MQQRRKLRYFIAFILLAAGILSLLFLNIAIGSVDISLQEMLAAMREKNSMTARILWEIRMPRTLAACILGGALALAGYLLQTFFIIRLQDLLYWGFLPVRRWSWHW